MTPDSTHTAAATAPPERPPQAVWPWLLLPLVVLAVFFLLKTAKGSLPPPIYPHHAEAPADSAPSEDASSH